MQSKTTKQIINKSIVNNAAKQQNKTIITQQHKQNEQKPQIQTDKHLNKTVNKSN